MSTQATTQIANAQSLGIAVAVFSLNSTSLDSYSLTTLKTSVASHQDPFTGGEIPDLQSHLGSSANLSTLVTSTGSLSPTFSSSTTSYTMTVGSFRRSLRDSERQYDRNYDSYRP